MRNTKSLVPGIELKLPSSFSSTATIIPRACVAFINVPGIRGSARLFLGLGCFEQHEPSGGGVYCFLSYTHQVLYLSRGAFLELVKTFLLLMPHPGIELMTFREANKFLFV